MGTIWASCVAACFASMALRICRVGSSALTAALRAAARSTSSAMYFFPASSWGEAAGCQRLLWLQKMRCDCQLQRQRRPQPPHQRRLLHSCEAGTAAADV